MMDSVFSLLFQALADLNEFDNFRRTPLLWAASQDHAGVVAQLVEANADVDW